MHNGNVSNLDPLERAAAVAAAASKAYRATEKLPDAPARVEALTVALAQAKAQR